MFVERLLDYSCDQDCIWALATLHYSVPQVFCCEYALGALTEKLGRVGESMRPRRRVKTNVSSLRLKYAALARLFGAYWLYHS